MKTIVKKKLEIETKRHDFDNEFAYVETWHNTHLKDCFFAEKQFLWPDGSLKAGGKKYFLGRSPDSPEKEIKCVNYNNFNNFDHLYYFGENGEIMNIVHK
ncbi:hypothetical protein N9973_00610 [bacterium]|nr:hypothetical protein [bacterium]